MGKNKPRWNPNKQTISPIREMVQKKLKAKAERIELAQKIGRK